MALLKYFKRIEPSADEQISTTDAIFDDDDNDNVRTWLPLKVAIARLQNFESLSIFIPAIRYK